MNVTLNITQVSPLPVEEEKFDQFEKDLRELLNSHSMENFFNMPDYILAKFLRSSLENLANAQSTGPEYFRI